jgi:hypothetical protein
METFCLLHGHDLTNKYDVPIILIVADNTFTTNKPMTNQHVLSMNFNLKKAFLINLLFMLFFFCAPLTRAALHCEENYQFRFMTVSECEALMQIYNATDGPNWQKNRFGDDPWDADGPICGSTVVCSDDGPTRGKHVVQLNLKIVGMDGVLPGSAFASLPYLHQIDLSNNSLHGLIPVQIAELPAIKTLILSHNEFVGAIPEDLLGDGEALPPFYLNDSLNLSNNNLSGRLPLSLGREDVKHFWVADNPNLNGPIPLTYIQKTQMVRFLTYHTQICEPQNQAMQDWLDDIIFLGTGISCDNLPDPDPPAIPGLITASDGTSEEKIDIKWGISVDADFYDLERSKIGSSIWNELATPSVTSYVDSGAKPGILYRYRVKACHFYGGCSNYTKIEEGYRNLKTPEFNNDNNAGEVLTWDYSINAAFYRLYEAVDNAFHANFDKDNFELVKIVRVYSSHKFLINDRLIDHPSVAIQACNSLTCSGFEVWNSRTPLFPALGLLLGNDFFH